jgi:two-component system OmpR family response regulator
MARMLRLQGFAVTEAATVAEAVAALAPRPTWILLDLMLPDGSGVEVLRAVRAAGLPTRVCVVTGSGSDMVAEAERAGAERTFLKPLDVGALMSVLTP